MNIAQLSIEESLQILRNSSTDKSIRIIAKLVLEERVFPHSKGKFYKKDIQKCIEIIRSLRTKEYCIETSPILVMIKKDMHQRALIIRGIKARLTYPLTQFVILCGAMSIMLTFVVPQLAAIYTDLHAELPLLTRVIMDVANFFDRYSLLLICAVIIAILTVMKLSVHFVLSLLPVVGSTFRELSYAQYFGYLGSFMHLGKPKAEAFTSAAEMVMNRYYSQRLLRKSYVSDFHSHIAHSFHDPVIGAIIEAGETSDTLNETCDALSEHYTAISKEGITAVFNSVEPILILIIGIIVGLCITGIYLPLFDIVTLIN